MLLYSGEELKKQILEASVKDALSILDRQDYLLQLPDQILDLGSDLVH